MLLRNKKLVPRKEPEDISEKLPTEILAHILSFTDSKTLLACRLVSKRWKMVVENEVFRLIMEKRMYQQLILNGGNACRWHTYFMLWKKKPLGRNLLQNNIVQGPRAWDFTAGEILYYHQEPTNPINTLPVLEDYEKSNTYHVTGNHERWLKTHLISLEKEGFTTDMLNTVQPTIEVSEWFAIRTSSLCQYTFTVELLSTDFRKIRSFNFTADLADGKWRRISYSFENYGRGVAHVFIRHHARNQLYSDELPDCIITGEVIKIYLKKSM